MSFLKPSKHTNLRYSIINISATILKILKDNAIVEYSELLELLKLKIGKEVEEVFLLSLSFLYIHKKVEYIKELDSIRLSNEVI
ncbi:MAG: hypothetical protein NTW78_11085 [Campylobacterales bacterium]|nr:hypothetical protein [Campylobacterales bacterium]